MLDSFFQREDIPRPGWALSKLKEFCKQNKLKPAARWGKRGKPIKKDYEDCIKKYIEDTDECKYRAEEIMNSYGIVCIRLPPYHPEVGGHFNPPPLLKRGEKSQTI